MKYTILLLFFSSLAMAQNGIGLEFRASSNMTFNLGEIISGQQNWLDTQEAFNIVDERNPITLSYSGGISYRFNQNLRVKVHVGYHKNGRIYDMEVINSSGRNIWLGINKPFRYIQFTPSISYSFNSGKSRIPLDIGVSINKRIDELSIFIVSVTEYNYDIRTSIGYEYELLPHTFLGINLVYAFSPTGYHLEPYLNLIGNYIPHQLGLELSTRYDF